MISETPQTLPALPIRRRETLEIFDTALKLYRRYFWVLLGWSALVSVMAFVPILSFFSIFTMPLLYGAVSCCVAAAVRGQKVHFSQCWAFTKPRYGALLGVTLLSGLVLFGILIGFYIAAFLVVYAGTLALANAPEPVQILAGIVGFLLVLVGFSAMGVVAFGWMNMVPIVACLEDDKRGTAAMGRAFELLKGQWRRVFGMSLILGLAMIAVFGIAGGVMMLGVGAGNLRQIFGSNPSQSAIWGIFGTFSALTGLFFLLWNPAQSLVLAVLYLDLRVRREALDLEWTAYASAPANQTASSSAPKTSPDALQNVNPLEVAPQNPSLPLETPTSFAAGNSASPGEFPSIFPPTTPLSPQAPLAPPIPLAPPLALPDENEAKRD